MENQQELQNISSNIPHHPLTENQLPTELPKKKTKWFLFSIIIFFLSVIALTLYLWKNKAVTSQWLQTISLTQTNEEKYCQIDVDCVAVRRNQCCGCPDDSVNKRYVEIIENETKQKCKEAACLNNACDLTNYFPKCINHECVFKEVNHSTYTADECQKLSNQDEKYFCLHTIANLRKDPRVCYLIDEQERQDQCLLVLSHESTDETICQKIKSEHYSPTCYQRIAVNSKDVSLCLNIADEEKKSQCIYQTVIQNPEVNPANCQLATYVRDEYYNIKDKCFDDVAVRDNNSSLCTDNSLTGNYCKAVLLKNSDYCKQIPSMFKGLIETCNETSK